MHGLRALFFLPVILLNAVEISVFFEGGYPSIEEYHAGNEGDAAGFQNQTAERKLFTDEELQREFDYYMAQKLLEADQISEGELTKITAKKPPVFLLLIWLGLCPK